MVGDRRLTDARTLPPKVIDDDRHKLVLLDNRISLGFTGLAYVGFKPTASWLQETIIEGPGPDASAVMQHVRDRATEAFKKIRLPRCYLRTSFDGVGWFFLKEHGAVPVPGFIRISNMHGDDGEILAEARDEFVTFRWINEPMPDVGFRLESTGFEPSPQEKGAIWRLVRRCVKGGCGAPGMIRAMAIGIGWLSRTYPTIGPGVMAISIPAVASVQAMVTGRHRIWMGPFPSNEHVFMHYWGAPGGDPHIQRAALFVRMQPGRSENGSPLLGMGLSSKPI